MREYPFETSDFDGEMKKLGFDGWGFVNTDQIPFDPEVRHMCEVNRCGQYGKTWACPPGVGTFEECRDRCLAFPRALVFSGCYQLEDCFDYEGMQEGHRKFAESCALLHRKLTGRFLFLSNEGCKRCEKCAYPEPCRFPETLSPSVEGFGVMVFKLAQAAGLTYHKSSDTICYFGMCCFE